MDTKGSKDCIDQIDYVEKKITEYNNAWNIWNKEYERLGQEIIDKQKTYEIKDLEFYNWILHQMINNPYNKLIKDGYESEPGRNGCGTWKGNECSDRCQLYKNITPMGKSPPFIDHYHTHKKHCASWLAVSETYRCYCKVVDDESYNNKFRDVLTFLKDKTDLQNKLTQHVKDVPKLNDGKPIIVNCCLTTIECDNNINGPNSCYGNLQKCYLFNENLLKISERTELEKNNKDKIIKIYNDLGTLTNQINDLLNSIFNLSNNLSNLIDNSSISNSLLNIKKIYEQISLLVIKIETIKNIDNIENEAKLLFNNKNNTAHEKEMQSIFNLISDEIKIIKNLILQAKKTFSDIKIIYETIQDEDLNINLLKIEQTKILGSIKKINDYINILNNLYDIANKLTLTQDEIDIFVDINDKSIVLGKNINLEIKELNEFKNSIKNIFNKFTIDSFFIKEVKLIYNESINNINNITTKINENNINTIIKNINSIFLKKKNIYESEIIRFDEKKLKIIQDEELKSIKSEITNNDIKQEETSGINIIYIIIGIVLITIIFFYLYK
jgi:hypothetical protein